MVGLVVPLQFLPVSRHFTTEVAREGEGSYICSMFMYNQKSQVIFRTYNNQKLDKLYISKFSENFLSFHLSISGRN